MAVSERAAELFEAITDIDEEYIEEAGSMVFKKQRASRIPVIPLAAAAAALVLGIPLFMFLGTGLGSHPGSGLASGGAASFQNYEGPIFPLGAVSDTEGITAVRSVDFDFSEFSDEESVFAVQCRVTDSYILTNGTQSDITVSAVYPFAAGFGDDIKYLPDIYIDGEKQDGARLYAGRFSGSFISSERGGSDRTNLRYISSYEGYSELLSDGEYLKSALYPYEHLDEKIKVYSFSCDLNGETAEYPTVSVDYTIDRQKTKLLTYGFNGWHRNGGEERHIFSLPEDADNSEHYIIISGEDISGIELKCWRSAACREGEELEGAVFGRSEYETTLGEFITELVTRHDETYEMYVNRLYGWGSGDTIGASGLADRELLIGCAVDLLYSYGAFSDDPAERYGSYSLEEALLGSYSDCQRVLYLSFDIEIPAGESVSADIIFEKQKSYDFITGKTSRYGYDLMTVLDSQLEFVSETARLSGINETGALCIGDNDFGFDTENGITQVTLDTEKPHYYLTAETKK